MGPDPPEEFSWFDRNATAALRRFRHWPPGTVLLVPLVLMAIPIGIEAVGGRLGVHLPALRGAILLTVSLVPGLFMLAAIWRALSIGSEFSAAYEKEDFEAIGRLKRLMDGVGPPRTPFDRANRLLGEAELFLHFERWSEARDLFDRIERESLPELLRPGVLSELGYATAHAGQPELGLERATQAWKEAEAQSDYPDGKYWFVRARLGITLSLAGLHDDASEVLRDVLCLEGGDARMWTAAQFFLACSLRASGDFDEAAAHLGHATEGEGPYVQRAKAALELAKGAPLRASAVLPEPEDERGEPLVEAAEGGDEKRAALRRAKQ
ncbi:hypothetical protein BH11MYX4_BH11MYX4_44580 [soil metagenome]